MIPYLNMNARVTIGDAGFTKVTAFRIEETVREIGNKATIQLPREYKSRKGKPILDVIKAGDSVKIEAGYNGKFFEEFTGYVRHINAEMPLTIVCDDKFYPLRQNNWVKAYKSTTLKALLSDITTGFAVDCPEVSLGKFEIDNASTYEVLRKIQQDYGLFSRIIGDTLVVGFSWDWQVGITNQHKYHRQKNVRRSNLQWKRKEDFKLRVRVEYLGDKKKKKHVDVGFTGTGGNVKTVQYHATNEANAKSVGESVLRILSYDGFTGSVSGFGAPRTHAGDSLEYQDDYRPEHNGVYLIEQVTIEYSGSGFSRENHVAYKIE